MALKLSVSRLGCQEILAVLTAKLSHINAIHKIHQILLEVRGIFHYVYRHDNKKITIKINRTFSYIALYNLCTDYALLACR